MRDASARKRLRYDDLREDDFLLNMEGDVFHVVSSTPPQFDKWRDCEICDVEVVSLTSEHSWSTLNARVDNDIDVNIGWIWHSRLGCLL